MNKKLIDRHNGEVEDLNTKLRSTRDELATKRVKLEKYVDIVKSFTTQMEMFDSFKESSNNEIKRFLERLLERLREQVKAKDEENKLIKMNMTP